MQRLRSCVTKDEVGLVHTVLKTAQSNNVLHELFTGLTIVFLLDGSLRE